MKFGKIILASLKLFSVFLAPSSSGSDNPATVSIDESKYQVCNEVSAAFKELWNYKVEFKYVVAK